MMNGRLKWLLAIAICILVHHSSLIIPPSSAAVAPDAALKIYQDVAPSLVVVQYTWESELGRQELNGSGIIISDDGTVVCNIGLFDQRIPDEQMTEFKIVRPRETEDDEEIPAVFIGRDERTNMALIKSKRPGKFKPLKFEDVDLQIGDPVLSVGLLPKVAGYRSYLMQANVAAKLRGEVHQILVSGEGVGAIGSPVLDAQGRAVGIVGFQTGQSVLLNDPRNPMSPVMQPPRIFVPTTDFVQSLTEPPVAGKPQELPWIGVPQLNGVRKDVAEYFGIQNQPAIQVGDIIPGSPADKAGLKAGQIIVKIDGKPLERGDEPDELPSIFRRQLLRMKTGSTVTLGVIPDKGQPIKDVKVTLETQPKRANMARRFWAEDLGFTARETVFFDTYVRKLPPDAPGVVVALIKPQGSAQNGRMQINDLITQINGQKFKGLDEFRGLYEDFRRAHQRQQVVLVVLRDGKEETIRIEPPQ